MIGRIVSVAALLIGLMFASGCGASQAEIVNGAHSVGLAARDVLHEECTLEYQQADTESRVAELDHFCKPLRAAYKVLRTTHALFLEAVAAGADEEEIALLVMEVSDAALEVGRLVAERAQ